MGNLYVPLPSEARAGLIQLARRELRHPRQQAALLILEGLRRHEVLTETGEGGAAHAMAVREVSPCSDPR